MFFLKFQNKAEIQYGFCQTIIKLLGVNFYLMNFHINGNKGDKFAFLKPPPVFKVLHWEVLEQILDLERFRGNAGTTMPESNVGTRMSIPRTFVTMSRSDKVGSDWRRS